MKSRFAEMHFLTASTKISDGTGGMDMRPAPSAKRAAFWSGRKHTTSPSTVRNAFMPSKMPWP
jgi:hypothetical protein